MYRALFVVALGLVLSGANVASHAQDPVQAIIVFDINTKQHGAVSAKMDGLGWTVNHMRVLDLINRDGHELAAEGWDLIWTPATSSYSALRQLMEEDGTLAEFATAGGMVVIMGVNPDSGWLDVAPGGADAFDNVDGSSTTIVAPDHPMVSGVGTGGIVLEDWRFDPFATGGRATFDSLPDSAEVIVTNSKGPVVTEYLFGAGRVWLAATDREHTACSSNLLLYIQTIF